MHEIAYTLITPDDNVKPDPDLTSVAKLITMGVTKVTTMVKANIYYILSAVVLNPVLFLHGLNAVFTATMSKLNMPDMLASFVEPHIDINNNHNHAVAYTLFITYAQWRACQRCLEFSSRQEVGTKATAVADEDNYWEADN